MSSPLRVEMLELQAERQRDRLENHVIELRQNVREKLDVERHVRKHVWPVSGVVAAFGLALGFSLAGIFARD